MNNESTGMSFHFSLNIHNVRVRGPVEQTCDEPASQLEYANAISACDFCSMTAIYEVVLKARPFFSQEPMRHSLTVLSIRMENILLRTTNPIRGSV